MPSSGPSNCRCKAEADKDANEEDEATSNLKAPGAQANSFIVSASVPLHVSYLQRGTSRKHDLSHLNSHTTREGMYYDRRDRLELGR